MLDAKGLAAHIEVMPPAEFLGLGAEAIRELRTVVSQHLGDAHRRGLVDALQEVHGTSLSLIVIQAYVYPVRGPVDGHKEIAALGLVGHLRQAFDVHVYEAWLVVLKGLQWLGGGFVQRIKLGAQRPQIAGVVPHKASIQRRPSNIPVDELAREDEQVIQGQQQHAAQLVRAMAQIGRLFTPLPFANRNLDDIVSPSQLDDRLLRGLESAQTNGVVRACGWMRVKGTPG